MEVNRFIAIVFSKFAFTESFLTFENQIPSFAITGSKYGVMGNKSTVPSKFLYNDLFYDGVCQKLLGTHARINTS